MSTKHRKAPYGKELPENWQVFHSKKHSKFFYHNSVTKKTQWQHPLVCDKANNEGQKRKSKKPKNTTGDKNSTKRTKGVKTEDKQQVMTKQLPVSVHPEIKSETLDSTVPRCIKPKSVTKPCKNDSKLSGTIQCLPPMRNSTVLRSPSEGSDSSDRITAWLENTSQINFTEHPVPGTNVAENILDELKSTKSNLKQDSIIKSGISGKTKEAKKTTILERVKSNTGTSETKGNNILDELLPKHASHKGCKTRYAPYKGATSESQMKSRKVEQSLKEKTSVPLKTKGKESDCPIKFTVKQANVKPKVSSENVFKIKKSDFKPVSVGQANASQAQQHSVLAKGIPVEPRHTGNAVQENNDKDNKFEFIGPFQHEDALSMDEEEECVSLAASLPDSEVADMEIDNAEQYEKEIVQKLQQIRDNLVVDPSNVSQEKCDHMNVASDGYEGLLYVVLDTNVLLSHLKFVVELKDFPIQGVGRPILVVPWVVIQELDSLKDNKWKRHNSRSADSNEVEERVDMLARIAIKFLNGCFQKSDPRVRGQTIDEAAAHVGNLKEESNDDRILQCCLLFQERVQNGNCVLFSNDRNLCNKALVNGIKAFNHQRLISGLRDLFQCGTIVKQAYFEEYKAQLGIQEELAWRREKADEILCELQIILREGLSYIIETEMKEAYDDLWSDIVHIKPPWTLNDVLQLLEKHWIAVFGHIVKRNHRTYVEEMRKKFDDRKGTPSSLVFSAEVLELSLKLFQSFAAHSNYNDAIPKCLAAVNVLIQKCQQYQAKVFTELTQNARSQPKCLTNCAESDQTSAENINAVHDGIVSNDSVPPHNEVLSTFNLIWTAVTQFSTQIFTALGYPNSISHELAQDFPKASKEEAIQFLGVLCPRLVNLVSSIQNVLRDPWEKASQNDSLFLQLEQVIAVFLKEVMSRDNYANAERLFRFCQDASMRTSLVQGLSQLDRASAMLQHCASCITQPSDGLR